jgi:hypothetical protein
MVSAFRRLDSVSVFSYKPLSSARIANLVPVFGRSERSGDWILSPSQVTRIELGPDIIRRYGLDQSIGPTEEVPPEDGD